MTNNRIPRHGFQKIGRESVEVLERHTVRRPVENRGEKVQMTGRLGTWKDYGQAVDVYAPPVVGRERQNHSKT